MMNPKRILYLLALLSPNLWAQQVTIWEYHNFPPMIISEQKQQGLTYGFTRLLNHAGDGEFEFKVQLIDLPSLLQKLDGGLQGVVLFVSPIWFDDANFSRYFWSETVMELRDEVVSSTDLKFEYTGPESYVGKKVGGIAGYTYPGLDEMVIDGTAKRIDFSSDVENLKNLIEHQAIDVAIVNQRPLKFYSTLLGYSEKIHVSKQSQGRYEVRILVTKGFPQVFEFVNSVVDGLDTNSRWHDLRVYYLD